MRDLKIEKLSDEFDQYLIFIECACGQTRRCDPSTLAHIAGWDARLADVVKRMRCSKCGERRCAARSERSRGNGFGCRNVGFCDFCISADTKDVERKIQRIT
jgi:hypothetical protein